MMVIDNNLSIDTLGIRNLVEFTMKNKAKCEVVYDETWNKKNINQNIKTSEQNWNDIKEQTISLIKYPIQCKDVQSDDEAITMKYGYTDSERDYLLTGFATQGVHYTMNREKERGYEIVNLAYNYWRQDLRSSQRDFTCISLHENGIVCRGNNNKENEPNSLTTIWYISFANEEERNRVITFFEKLGNETQDVKEINLPFTNNRKFWENIISGKTDGMEDVVHYRDDLNPKDAIYTISNKDQSLQINVYKSNTYLYEETDYTVEILYNGWQMDTETISPEYIDLSNCSYGGFLVWCISQYGTDFSQEEQIILQKTLQESKNGGNNYVKQIEELINQNIGRSTKLYDMLNEFLDNYKKNNYYGKNFYNSN